MKKCPFNYITIYQQLLQFVLFFLSRLSAANLPNLRNANTSATDIPCYCSMSTNVFPKAENALYYNLCVQIVLLIPLHHHWLVWRLILHCPNPLDQFYLSSPFVTHGSIYVFCSQFIRKFFERVYVGGSIHKLFQKIF